MGIFKSYDIRGVYGREWDRSTAFRIGTCLPGLLGARDILVGRDARESSEDIFEALSRGIGEAGAAITDIGLCDTPAVYFATAFYDFSGSVMITASHNPPEYNGLKISRRQAIPVGYDSGLKELELLVEGAGNREGKDRRQPRIRRLDIRRDYLRHLEPFREGIQGITAVVDCSDGMASVFIHDVFRKVKARILPFYDRPDGRFPHHAPNPLIEENLADLKRRTLEEKADVGVCFDGDADRVMFVNEQGRFISPDLITALLGLHFLKDSPGGAVTYDVRSSRSVVEYIEKLGGRPVVCKVGHSHAKKLLRELQGVFGGELAGHYYFRNNFFCDSGMIACLVVLSILSRQRTPLSELIGRISRYHSSGEINFRVSDKDRIIETILSEYRAGGRLTDIDGIRLDYPTWWFNLRKSNTEPFLRLVVEASGAEELEHRREELCARIAAIDPTARRE